MRLRNKLQFTISSPSRFWGSYRPGVYFGLKTRSPADLLAGLMWMLPGKVAPSNLGLRHWCDQNDGLSRYGDGKMQGIWRYITWNFGAPLNSPPQCAIYYVLNTLLKILQIRLDHARRRDVWRAGDRGPRRPPQHVLRQAGGREARRGVDSKVRETCIGISSIFEHQMGTLIWGSR